MFSLWARDGAIAIDLGSSNTLIYRSSGRSAGRPGGAFVANEPSVVALAGRGAETRVVAAGRQAAPMLGRTRSDVRVVWPVRNGVVSDTGAAAHPLRALVDRALGPGARPRRVLIPVPHDASPVEQQAFRQTAERLGADDIRLVYEPVAAAIGAGLDVLRPRGRLLVDVGSGITEAVVLSMGQVVAYHSVRKGGDALNERIVEHVRWAKGMKIGTHMAERVKLALGPTLLTPEERQAPVRGQWLESRLPGEAQLSKAELQPVFTAIVDVVIHCVWAALGKVEPELATDICDDGIWLSGGSLLVPGMEAHLGRRLGLAVRMVPDPLASVALGNGRLPESEELYRAVAS